MAISPQHNFYPPGVGSDSLVLIGSNGNTLSLNPGTISTSFSLTLPTDDGTNGDVLQTDGAGILTWTSPSANGNPSGTIITFAGASCPTGYLAADGTAVSRTTYSNLWNALGTTTSPWGQGDGSTTFNVPDLRNRFLRGTGTNGDLNGGTTVALGTYQGDAFQGHQHGFSVSVRWRSDLGSPSGGGGIAVNDGTSPFLKANVMESDGSNGTPRTASETRPKAYGVLMCIKS